LIPVTKCTKITVEEHFQFFPNFPIFPATFPFFLTQKPDSSYHEHLKKKELAKSIQPFSSDALTNEHHFIFIISRVQMKSWAGKALETVNCCAFLKRSSWSMLTANLKLRAKKFFLFFLSLQYFTLKIE
jgi:hypothetical protein